MNKDGLINRLSECGYTKKDAGTIIDDVFDLITEILVSGDSVMISGFGTFDVKEHAGREIKAVNTMESSWVPAYKNPKFTPGKTLKRAVREGFVRGG